jgi:alkylated DNA repair dioxygenase AlkB
MQNLDTETLSISLENLKEKIPGLRYEDNFLTEEEEKYLLDACNTSEWSNELKRRTQHYGYKYTYKTSQLNQKLGELPSWCNLVLSKLKSRNLNGFDQLIVNEYTPGQGIAAHIDAPKMFDNCIVSVSLGSDCIMNFEKDGIVYEQVLRRRSVVILQDEARYQWKHEIKARKSDIIEGKRQNRDTRISLTFRRVI